MRRRRARVCRAGASPSPWADHDVADEADALGRRAFAPEIDVGVAATGEQQVGNGVRGHAVDLFGHGAVAAAQSGLDMRHADAEFDGHQRPGQGRVDVADDDEPIGPLALQQLAQRQHGPGRLFGMGPRSDAEEIIRPGHAEIGEKHVGHQRVVMLARMDQTRSPCGTQRAQGFPQGEHLHVIRPGAGQQVYFHGWHISRNGNCSGRLTVHAEFAAKSRSGIPARPRGVGESARNGRLTEAS